MKSFLLLFSLLTLSTSAFAENNVFKRFGDMLTAPKPVEGTNKKKSYEFITRPRDSRMGNFTVTCYLPNGQPVPNVNGLQIKQFSVELTYYRFVTINDKVIYAPVDMCINAQN